MVQTLDSGTTIPTGTWVLDAAASRFEFQVKHFWGLITVKGSFERAEGQASVDASGAIAATLQIDAASVESKQKQRDKHLRSADFFHAEQHPTITFATRKVTVLAPDRLHIEGMLTVAGHAELVAFEARLTTAGASLVVDAQVQVDRTIFGMTWSPMGMAARSALLVVRAQFSKASAA
jgi:polyisoprenoid-binding protein YceI